MWVQSLHDHICQMKRVKQNRKQEKHILTLTLLARMKFESRLDCCTHTKGSFFRQLHHQQTRYSSILMPFYFLDDPNQPYTIFETVKSELKSNRISISTMRTYTLPHLNMTHAHSFMQFVNDGWILISKTQFWFAENGSLLWSNDSCADKWTNTIWNCNLINQYASIS